jgi:hypothetical protein
LWPALVFKQTFGLSLDLSLPLADLYRMDAILLSNLIDGFHPTERLQPHLGFELR